jgi:hypothetical protein
VTPIGSAHTNSRGMGGQLGQMTLHVAERESLTGLLGGGEQVGGKQLGTLDHTHGENRRPAYGRGVAQVSKASICAGRK